MRRLILSTLGLLLALPGLGCAALYQMHYEQLEEAITVEPGATLPTEGSCRVEMGKCTYAPETLKGWQIPRPCTDGERERLLSVLATGLEQRGIRTVPPDGAAPEQVDWVVVLDVERTEDSSLKSARVNLRTTQDPSGTRVWEAKGDDHMRSRDPDFASTSTLDLTEKEIAFILRAYDYRRDPAAYRKSVGGK